MHAHLISSLSILQWYYPWCGRRMIEHVVLSEDEMQQLSEDEYHRHLTNTDLCNAAISVVFGTVQSEYPTTALEAIDTGSLTATCFTPVVTNP